MISERKMDQPEDRSEDFFAQIAQRTQQMKATLANLKRSVPSPGESPAASAEGAVSFLSLLEQRADQLKTTLANLKADKMRAEALIAQLEPLMPQYDALIAAERSLVDAQADIDHAQQEQAETAPGG
jgi:phage shock protein A